MLIAEKPYQILYFVWYYVLLVSNQIFFFFFFVIFQYWLLFNSFALDLLVKLQCSSSKKMLRELK